MKTEIQKAMENQFNDIDFNKLIKENALINDVYRKTAKQITSMNINEFAKNKEYVLAPGINTISLINAILNNIHISDATVPFVIAGLDIVRSLYAANLDKDGIEVVESTRKVLEHCVTGIKL